MLNELFFTSKKTSLTSSFLNLQMHLFISKPLLTETFTFSCSKVPPLLSAARVYSYGEIYKLARPLEAIWRLATFRFRALPDVIVLGEVNLVLITVINVLKN